MNTKTTTETKTKPARFKFYASALRYYTLEAEGTDEDNALELAYQKKQQWEEVLDQGDWQINNVEEIR